MNSKQLELLEHTLGVRRESDRRRAGWRNHFATEARCDHWADIQALVAEGLMVRGTDSLSGLTYFHATRAGIAEVKKLRWRIAWPTGATRVVAGRSLDAALAAEGIDPFQFYCFGHAERVRC